MKQRSLALTVPLQGLQLIEASAGTGKTYTICLLYLRLLLEQKLSVERLLVVTFTNAAAAELRERIRSRLAELQGVLVARMAGTDLSSGDDCELHLLLEDVLARTELPPERLLLQVRLALQGFDQAAIYTIHGFCQRAMGDAPFVAGAPLSTELLTSDDALRLEVVQDFWRRRVAGQALPVALVQALRSAGDCPATCADLLRRAQSRPLAQARWGESEAETDDANSSANANSSAAVMQQQFESSWQTLQALWPAARECVPAMLRAALPGLSKQVYKDGTLALAHQHWTQLLDSGDPWSVPADKHKLHLYRRDKAVFTAAGARLGLPRPDHPLLDAAQNFLDARAQVLQMGGRLRRQLLRDLLEECGPALRQRKRALRVQAFDDMLFNLHAALQSEQGGALALSLRERYPAAMVDEFQDTDPLQWQILQCIYADSALPRFLVGDPKQAIYRFRNADLPTYLAARSTVPEALHHTLRHNQRSTPQYIAACNALFTVHDGAFIDPGLRYVPVKPGDKVKGVVSDARPGSQAALQVWLLPRDADGAVAGLPALRQQAAESCAAEVVSLLQGAAVGQVQLDGQPLQAGHLAVLVQKHAEGRLIRAALEARGVQCVELSQANVFASVDAQHLLRLMQAVLQPAREALVRDALATPWLGLSALQIDSLAATEQGLAPVMRGFADALACWRSRGFAVMMRRLLERHGVHARLLLRADGPRRLTNLRQLLELAHVASRSHAGPEALELWLRHQIDQSHLRDDSAQLRLESDARLVHIVTVHAAKGLEYPVVFCPFLWVNSGSPNRQPDCIDYPDLEDSTRGLVLDYRSSEERRQDEQRIKTARQQADDAERMRLIYVALTRAAQRCYLLAGVYASGRSGRDGAPNLKNAVCSPLNWLLTGGGQVHGAWRTAAQGTPESIDGAWRALAHA